MVNVYYIQMLHPLNKIVSSVYVCNLASEDKAERVSDCREAAEYLENQGLATFSGTWF